MTVAGTWRTVTGGIKRVSAAEFARGSPMTTTSTAERRSSRHEPHRPARRKGSAPPRRSGGDSAAASVGEPATRLELPVVGTVDIPPRDLLVYLGGLGALAVVGLIE